MKVLVVVDMQNDFITGPLGTKEARMIVPLVKAKIADAVKNGDYIIYTRDTHFEDYLSTREGLRLPVKHCIYKTKGWRIPDELFPHNGYEKMEIVDKFTFGYYDLPGNLARNPLVLSCNEIELVGLCTDICVVSNALLFKSRFYQTHEISVDAACCAGVTPETHEAALKTMEMCQINVKR